MRRIRVQCRKSPDALDRPREGFPYGRLAVRPAGRKPSVLREVWRCPPHRVIPAYRDVPVSIIRNLMRTANMSRERYFELLSQARRSAFSLRGLSLSEVLAGMTVMISIVLVMVAGAQIPFPQSPSF